MTDLTDGGYAPKAKGEKRFAAKHVVNKHPDRSGNGDDVFKASKIKQVKKFAHGHGYDGRDDESVYEETLEEKRSKEELLDKWQDHISASVENSKRGKENPLFAKTYKKKAEKHLLAARTASNMMKEEEMEDEDLDESVEKKTFSWGKMITVRNGISHTYPLHPEHQEKIKNLVDGESTKFKDEQGYAVTAKRTGNKIHLSNKNDGSDVSFNRSHLTESEEDLEEAKAVNRIKYTPGTGFQHSKNGGFTWKKISSDEAKTISPSKHAALSAEHDLKEEMGIEEALSPDMGIEKYISDFIESNAPQFEGKSKKERIKMATAAYYSSKGKKAIGEEVEEIDEISNAMKARYINARYTNQAAKPPTGSETRKASVNKGINRAWKGAWEHNDAESLKNKPPVAHKTHDLSDMSHEQAYDHTQTSDKIKDGHILKLSGGAKAIMYRGAWPTLVSGKSSVMHKLNDGESWDNMDGGRYKKSAEIAKSLKEETLDEISGAKARAYADTVKTDMDNDRPVSDKRKSGRYLALAKYYGGKKYGLSAKVPATESVLDRVLDNLLPEETTLDESFSRKISAVPASFKPLLEELFTSLDEENKVSMIDMASTTEGVNSLIDFALKTGE